MSGGVFDTQRPKSVQERVQELAARQGNREANLRALTEAKAAEKRTSMMNSVLENVDSAAGKEAQKNAALDKIKEETAAKQRKQNLASLESRLFTEGKKMLWSKVLFETAYDACWIDAPLKERLMQPLYETFESTVNFVQEVCPKAFPGKPSTRLLEAMDSIITEAAKKASKRIAKECSDDPNSDPDRINFDLNDEEEEKLNQDLQDLGKDDIADKVKDKVLTVIQDEKAAGKKKAETMKELDEAKKDDEDEDDDSDDEDDEDDESDDTDDDDDSDDDDSDDSDDEDEDKDKKKSKKSEDEDEDDDDKDDTDDDEDDKDSEDKTDNDVDDVTEGIVIGSVPPDEFYAATVKVFTDLYKKSPGNNASDTAMKFSKGARVNIQDYRKVKATGKKTFTRIINLSVDDGAKILKSNGFKQGTAKMLGYGLFFVKKLKEGYIEAKVAEAYKQEWDGVSTGGAYGSGGYATASAASFKYLKQCQVTVWYRKKASSSMRDRYTIESTGEVIGKTSMQIQLEQLTMEKMERDLRKSHAGSVFEALVMFDRVGVEQDALMEGVSVDFDKTMNAAMLEAIMQYTVIETLNTMGVCRLSSVDTSNIRKALMEDMNIMSADKNNSSKKTRINTMKYKRNRDGKVVAGESTLTESIGDAVKKFGSGVIKFITDPWVFGSPSGSANLPDRKICIDTIETMLESIGTKARTVPSGYKSGLDDIETTAANASIKHLVESAGQQYVTTMMYTTKDGIQYTAVVTERGIIALFMLLKKKNSDDLRVEPIYAGGKRFPREYRIDIESK